MSIQRKLNERERMAYASIAKLEETVVQEHAMRLEAERQVGELREQLANDAEFDRQMTKLEDANVALRAKLGTAMGVLRRIRHCGLDRVVMWHSEMDALLNTTSTEGKDHD